MVTPHLTINDIPMVVVNHTYDTQEMHSKKVVSGGCLVAGTELRMADGTVKSIEMIQVGDIVQTLIGDKEVTATWNPDTLLIGEPECYEIEFEDGSTVTCSNNHPFLIDGKWVVADDIVVGMDVTTL
jgi:intein/homing endonuclease